MLVISKIIAAYMAQPSLEIRLEGIALEDHASTTATCTNQLQVLQQRQSSLHGLKHTSVRPFLDRQRSKSRFQAEIEGNFWTKNPEPLTVSLLTML
jgi:hypothetical protein